MNALQLARDALKPFAALLQEHNLYLTNEQPIFGVNNALITRGDLGRALTAVSALDAAIAQEPVGEVVYEDFGGPFNGGIVRANFFTAVPEIGTKLYTTQQPAPEWIEVADGLPEIGAPVLAMVNDNPFIFPMMRDDSGDDGWLWASHRSGALNDPANYEADDDYDVVRWMLVPAPKARS